MAVGGRRAADRACDGDRAEPRQVDRPAQFLARARRQRGHFRPHRCGARRARGALRASGCSVATASLVRRAPSRPLRPRSPSGSSSRPLRTAPTRSSPRSSCSSTACSRSASCCSCGRRRSSGCSSPCSSSSPSSAVGYGLLSFLDAPFVESEFPGGGSRRSSASTIWRPLSTMMLALGLAALYTPAHRLGRLPLVAGIAGAVGVVLGAALAGLLGLYLTAGAIVVVALARGAATKRARRADRGRHRRDYDRRARTPLGRPGRVPALARGRGAAGRSLRQRRELERAARSTLHRRSHLPREPDPRHRLARSAAAGRVRALPRRCAASLPDEPANYFPSVDGFIPQQTYDQVLYELGIVGAVLFLVLAVVVVRAAARVVRIWPTRTADELAAYLPAAWVGALAGGLAGAALFGGVPLPPSSGSRSAWPRSRRRSPREPLDRARDRAAERRRRCPACSAACTRAGAPRRRGGRGGGDARRRRRVDGVRRRGARRAV